MHAGAVCLSRTVSNGLKLPALRSAYSNKYDAQAIPLCVLRCGASACLLTECVTCHYCCMIHWQCWLCRSLPLGKVVTRSKVRVRKKTGHLSVKVQDGKYAVSTLPSVSPELDVAPVGVPSCCLSAVTQPRFHPWILRTTLSQCCSIIHGKFSRNR